MAQLVKTISGLAVASCKTVSGLAIASCKTIMGVDNTSGGGGSFAEVQQVDYFSTAAGTSHLITWGTTPVNNNLLILTVVGDNIISTPAGWSVAITGSDFCETAIFYKVASGESGSVTVTTLTGHACITAFEYSGMATVSPFDVADANIDQADPIVCGPTATTAQNDELAIGTIGISGATPTVSSWDNAFVQQSDLVSTGTGTLVRNSTATKVLTATGTPTSNVDLSGAGNSHNVGLMATFKITNP